MLGISHDNAHCSGYLCPLADKCVRYLLAIEWEQMKDKFPVAFIQAQYENGKCENFWKKED